MYMRASLFRLDVVVAEGDVDRGDDLADANESSDDAIQKRLKHRPLTESAKSLTAALTKPRKSLTQNFKAVLSTLCGGPLPLTEALAVPLTRPSLICALGGSAKAFIGGSTKKCSKGCKVCTGCL